jgi:hypothetical protein
MNPPSLPPPPGALQSAGAGGAGAVNTQQLANLVRYWVHYDSILAGLNKDAKLAREARAGYEGQIVTMLRASNLQHPVIQIGGGRLVLAEEKHQQPLSFKNLELLLHQYYRTRPGSRDETPEILKFIRANREVEVSTTLRRQKATSRAKEKTTP